jgi:asparagine synthase (glutamine-hydrolysing)
MCGISGIISLDKSPVPYDLIQKFNGMVAHRGPDDEGFLVQESIALGHRRLSILDLSKDGHQPMAFKDRYYIVYNGEIYNYVELKKELEGQGYVFRTKTDTEVILAAYDKWGKECLDRFNGMWAFAIYDCQQNELFCSRDRFGVKPFYYRVSNHQFSFASEIKQFTTLPDWEARVNSDRLIEFIALGRFDHSEETLFEGVQQLRPGHYLVLNIETGTHSIMNWYNLRNKIKPLGDINYEKEFLKLMEDSVRLRLRSDVKVGSCLSGGLDSSTIVCLVNRILRASNQHEIQETVSSCFTDARYDEQHYIDIVTKAAEVKSNKVFPSYDNLFDKLDDITWQQDGPFGSSSIYAQWSVFKEARERGLIVMLDGQGADEQLAGYHPFFQVKFSGLLRSLKVSKLTRESLAFRKVHNMKPMQFLRLLGTSSLPKAVGNYLATRSMRKQFPWLKKKRTFKWFFEADTLQEFSIDQLTSLSLPMLLHYEDRNSMAFSVESRVPFLDYRLVEFILNLPDDLKVRDGITKYILRKSLTGILPSQITNRYDKMGFVTPEEKWIKENRSVFEEKLSSVADKLKTTIDKDNLLRKFREDFDRGIQIGSVYWRLISVDSWLTVFDIDTDS